jgi:hypothetical protein
MLGLGILLISSSSFARPKNAKNRVAGIPHLGKYTGIWVGTSEDFGRAEPDLVILAEGRYKQMDKIGRYSYDAKTRKITWLTGAIPKRWVGFFVPKGVDGAKTHTIVIRDQQDVAEGNKRDLRWYNFAK